MDPIHPSRNFVAPPNPTHSKPTRGYIGSLYNDDLPTLSF